MSRPAYLLSRLLQVLPTTFVVFVLAFLTFHVIGGSPAEVVLGQRATAEALAAFEARHGFDRPLLAGRWQRTRAFSDRTLDALTPDPAPEASLADAPRRVELPLAFALGEGRWRWRFRRLDPAVRSAARLRWEMRAPTDDVEVRMTPLTPRGRRSAVAELTVPGGLSVVRCTLELPSDLDLRGELRLRKATRHWLDSQFFNSLRDLMRGDFGESVSYGRPVAAVLREGVGASLALTVPIFVGGLLLGLMLGMVCAAFRGRWVDRVILVLCALLMSVNYVIWVIGAQYLPAFRWGWFPIWGFESARYLVLPVAVGILSGLGRDVRFYRTVILDERYRPHVRAAIARGCAPARLWSRHILRNSAIAIVTQISLSLPFLFMGSLLLERFFGIPGLGGVSLNALHSGDVSVVRAVVILGALLYQALNLVTDLCYHLLDPRVRLR